ncbi:MAG: TadE/TadG family type IV pilus assembly protein, partial [Acidobacteriota bacterium]
MRPFLSIRRWHAFTRFSRDARGISAVEFALLLPIMVALYLGGVELTDGLSVQRKVTLTANALVNLAGQTTSITTSDMTNILDAASAVMYPYPSANLTATLTCISIDPSTQQATVRWSVPFPSTGTHYAENQPLPFQINKDLITVKQSDGT